METAKVVEGKMEEYLLSDISKDYYESAKFTSDNSDTNNLNDLEFYECEFRNINFFSAQITACRFENCTFINCDLSLTNLQNSQFLEIEFNNCKLAGIDWRKALKPFTINFLESKLNDSIFFGLDLRGTEFTKCEIRNCDFERCNLTKVSFSESDLLNTKFNLTTLNQADFTYTINYQISPTQNKIKKAKFSQPEVLSLLDEFNINIE